MSLLTDQDRMAWHGPLRKMLQHHGITKHGDTVIEADILETVKPLIEAAVIKKLATVSVEPHEYVWEPDGTFNIGQERCLSSNTGPCHGWNIYPVYTAAQLAAARVQALEEALNCYSPDDTATDWADKIRALIGGEQ